MKNELCANVERSALAELLKNYGYDDSEISTSLEHASSTNNLTAMLRCYTDFLETNGGMIASINDSGNDDLRY